MKKMLTSVVAIGAGIAAYNLVQKNNMMSRRNMKKMQNKISKALF
ncbi:YrzQ family protein [Robertmurraya andreesenii]|nr:YrzQ family protein [Robertmurraya andreesenii]